MGTSSPVGRLRALLAYAPFAFRDTIVLRRFSRALGDNLMLTMLAREVKKAQPGRKVVVETNRPELFLHNPHVDLVLGHKVAVSHCRPSYGIEGAGSDHILDQLARSLPFPLPCWERRLDLFLTEADLRAAADGLPERYIAVCPVGKGTFAANRKDWGFDRFQRLVDGMPGRTFLQLGLGADPLLRGVLDFRGRDLRISAAALRRAVAAVVQEGGFMHLCHAVGRPAIVLFGGCLKPETVGYPEHLSVVSSPSCSPCWSDGGMEECPSMRCMDPITPALVRDLLLRERYLGGGVLEAGAFPP